MKKYFLYELKKNAFAIGCLTFIAIIICAAQPLMIDFKIPTPYNPAEHAELWTFSVVGGLLAVCIPVWLLSYRMKKRSVDLYYSLPISRTKILTIKLLIGLIAIFVPYTAAYWTGAFILMAKLTKYIHPVYFVVQYFGSLPAIYCIYAMASFAFTRANSFIDGIVFIFFWAFAAVIAANVLDRFTGNSAHSIFFITEYYAPYAPLDLLTDYSTLQLRGTYISNNYSTYYLINLILALTLTALLTAGATAGLFLTEKNSKAENAEQISESLFGYKTMIPFYTVGLLVIFDFKYFNSDFILPALTIVGAFLLTVLYRRTIKLNKKQLIVFGVSIAAGLALSLLLYLLGLRISYS